MNKKILAFVACATVAPVWLFCDPPTRNPVLERVEEILAFREKNRQDGPGTRNIPQDLVINVSLDEAEWFRPEAARWLLEVFWRFDRQYIRLSVFIAVPKHIQGVAAKAKEQGPRYRGPTVEEVRSWYRPLQSEVLRYCEHSNPLVAGGAIEALAAIGGPNAIPKLLQIVREGPTHSERLFAMDALGHTGVCPPEVPRLLCDVAVGELRFPAEEAELLRLTNLYARKGLQSEQRFDQNGNPVHPLSSDTERELLYPGIHLREQAIAALSQCMTEETFLRLLQHFMPIRDPRQWSYQSDELSSLTEEELLYEHLHSRLTKTFGLPHSLETMDWSPDQWLRWWEENGRPSWRVSSFWSLNTGHYSLVYDLYRRER